MFSYPCSHVSMCLYHMFMCPCVNVFMFTCFYVSMYLCVYVSVNLCSRYIHVPMFPCPCAHDLCIHVSMCPCVYVPICPRVMFPCVQVSMCPFVHVPMCQLVRKGVQFYTFIYCTFKKLFSAISSVSIQIDKFKILHFLMILLKQKLLVIE
jgi:hypothetical protein